MGQVGVLGVIDDHPAHRALAVQCSLRPAQHFDSVDIEVLQRRRGLVVGHSERRVIEIIADHAVADRAAGARTTERKDVIARADLLRLGRAGDQLDEVGPILHVPRFQRRRREGLNRHRHGAELLGANLRGGHHHFSCGRGVLR